MFKPGKTYQISDACGQPVHTRWIDFIDGSLLKYYELDDGGEFWHAPSDHPDATAEDWQQTAEWLGAEKILHDQFAAKRKDGEWFDLDADEVAYLMSINKFASGEFWQRAIPKSQPANQEKPF